MIPTLQQLHTTTDDSRGKAPKHIRAVVLAPTRELALQIGDATKDFAQRSNIKHTVIHGGVSDKPQIKKIRAGVDVLIATPGRLLDLINQRHISLSKVEIFILDEADRMLDM
jgi:ATP-dependent RNA helicase RhlE